MDDIVSPSLWDVQEKYCTICHQSKPLTDFYPHPHCLFGVLAQCKPCYIARQTDKEYKKQKSLACADCGEDDPEKFYYQANGSRYGKTCKQCSNRRKTRFGLKFDKREAMMQKQGGVCAICGKPEISRHQNGRIKTLSVDHDHKTGKIRGLLCSSCNHMLGLAYDDIEILSKAIAYLKKQSS